MKINIVWIIGIFVFLGIIAWQRIEVTKRSYILAAYSSQMDNLKSQRDRNFLRCQELKSSERMMRFGYEKKYKFPSASEVITIYE